MSITKRLTQRYLKETYVETISDDEEIADGILMPVPYETIQANKVYKIGDVYIEFVEVKEDEIYNFTLSTQEDDKEVGTVYRIDDKTWVARATEIPDIETTGKDMITAAINLSTAIGEL